MQKKEIVLTLGLLAEKGACKLGIEKFKKWYPSGSAPLTEVLRKLQELANSSTDDGEYVECTKWLVNNYPPTQEPLVINELTEKVIIHNGDIDVYSDVGGEYTFIGNGNLNIKGDVKLTGQAQILAKSVKGQNITLYGYAGISAEETIKAINIAAYGNAGISVAETIKATNIAAYGNAGISVAETIKATNIAAYGYSGIWAYEINTINIAAYSDAGIWAKKINVQNIMDDYRVRIHGEINLIQPSSNQQNTTTAS